MAYLFCVAAPPWAPPIAASPPARAPIVSVGLGATGGGVSQASDCRTGNVMPLNRMTFEDRGKETHCDTCKANGVVIGQAPGTGLVNEAAAHNGYPAPTARIS
ncbi:hypothetical protein INR49_029432, partial [Caranx melampygus]